MAETPYVVKYLPKIANIITIRDEDRLVCTTDFDIIRDYVLNGMKSVDKTFKRIFQGTSLFGSYANNVRIQYPGEFDVIFILSIPYSSQTVVERDPIRPGYVNLNLDEVMDTLSEINGYTQIHNQLDELIDSNGYLRRTNLQNWLKDIMETCLETYGYQVRGSLGDLYTLIYSKRGLAHTIYAKCKRRSLSIDFIPGICFGPADWMKIVRSRKFKRDCNQWYAVPKPPGDKLESNRCAFMVCNPRVERKLLLGKQNLKVVFRLLKSLRNAKGMKRLKSYFITTSFLWEIEKQNKAFWNRPVHLLLEHMLKSLAEDFSEGCLRFYWDRENNLLDILDDEEIEEYADILESSYLTIRQYKTEPNLSYMRCKSHFELPKVL